MRDARRFSIPRRWWLASRPHSLGTALAPVLLGGAVAIHDGPIRVRTWLVGLAGVSLLLVGANLANDYFDFRQGADPPLGVGSRPLQRGLLTPRAFLIGSLIALTLGGMLGLVVVATRPPAILIVGFVGAALGLAYTAPPLRLGYRGLGEIVVFLCLGPGAALGAYVATRGTFAVSPILAGVPIGLTVTAILQANNLRDLETDAHSGKRTLAVRLGRRGATIEYLVLLVGAEVATIALAAALTPFAALGLVTVVQVSRLWRQAQATPFDGRRLMQESATLNLRLAALLSLGFVISALIAH